MSLSVSQIVSVCSTVCAGISVAVGDLSAAALLPAHAAAAILAVVAVVSTVVGAVSKSVQAAS